MTEWSIGIALALAGCATATGLSSDREILEMALDDELRAEATYEAVLDRFGDVRPFSNIINAEVRHADAVRSEMKRLGYEPQSGNSYRGTIDAPKTLLAACEAGVQAERENIALYDELLPNVADVEARSVLERLQWASRERHLPAFERCVDRGGTPGRGRNR